MLGGSQADSITTIFWEGTEIFMESMGIPAVGKLLMDCWAAAEQAVRRDCDDNDEEFITALFRLELKSVVEAVSASGAVQGAFLHDLQQAFPFAAYQSLTKIAHGLIASVSFPDHSVESKTGGDLGILLVRPDLHVSYGSSQATVDRDYRRGLLSQAKMFRRDSRWGPLTSGQKRILQTKLSYFALLLYRYSDQIGARRQLAPFQWQLTSNATVEKMDCWLISDRFPGPQDSQQILGALIDGRIGTDDKGIIDRDIAPTMRRSLVIKIGWPDDDGPSSTVELQEHSRAVIHQYVLQR